MDSDSAGVLATLNATLAMIAPNTTLPADFNVSSALHWLTMFNASIAKGNATAVALMLKEFNITTPIPTSLATITPLINSTADAEKAKMAKLAAQKAYLLYVESRFHTLQLFLIAGYGIMCALCIGLVCYLRLNRSVAFKGDASAARKIILPAFEPLLIVIGTTTGLYTLFLCVALATGYFEQSISKLWTEVFYSGRQFVFLSVVVFMLQKSVSGPALQRSMLITLVLSTYTLPIVWYMVEYGNPKHMYAVLTISRSFMLLLYTYIFVRPPVRASKRTLREFCVYAYIYYALLYTYNDLFRQAKLEPGFNLTYANLLCGSLCPLVIFRVLKADTEHWRGMGERAVALQELFRQKHNLPERVSSKGLHVLIEMHRKYIIDFAYLELKQRIGTGASAVVFNGILRHKLPVAVKVYIPSDFDEETVAGFSQEAALCGALHHPNIVKFYGMCVCPPTICLVSELCQGSLEDVMTNMAQRAKHPNRQQLLINIMYMLDAARAVAYLHSFSPAFLHRDIKPANFLVDIDNTVKLTDFGESRSLPRSNIARNRRVNPGIRAAAITGDSRASNGSILKPTSRDSVALESGAGLQQVRGSEFVGEETTRMTIKGTVDYMAPEIINGKAGQATYGEAADVFSLGITMWDIMHPGREKYPGIYGNHFKIFEAVSQGQRPELDPTMPASLRMVIESAWQADPRLRPSAQNIVSILETIQEEVAAVFALELGEELEDELVLTKQGNKTAVEMSTFTGERAIEHMETHRFVGSTSEAVRLGNALLDAGLVHHLKHARPFENTTSVYFFDEDNINLCQPLTIGTKLTKLTEGGDSDTEDRMTVATTATRRTKHARSQRSSSTHGNTLSEHIYGSSGPSSEHTLLENGMCACRKLGQRLALPKALSRRRFRRNKYKAIAEESVLQASLLQEDHILSAAPELLLRHSHSEFEEFDSIHVPDARV